MQVVLGGRLEQWICCAGAGEPAGWQPRTARFFNCCRLHCRRCMAAALFFYGGSLPPELGRERGCPDALRRCDGESLMCGGG